MAELSAQPLRINYRRYHRQRLEFADIPLSLWLGWTVLLIAWPVAEILMDLQALSVDEVIVIILAGSVISLAPLFTDQSRRMAAIIWLLLLLYFVSAYLSFMLLGDSFAPFLSIHFLSQSTLDAMRSYALSFLVFFPCLRSRWCQAYIGSHADAVSVISNIRTRRVVAGCIILFGFGVVDWYCLSKLGIGLGAILESERRSFADQLVLTTEHNAQVVAIPLTIALLIHGWTSKSLKIRLLTSAISAFAWFPSFMVGSRKEVFIITIALLSVWMMRRIGILPLLVLSVFMLGLGLIPVIFGTDLSHSLHEFVLPFYNVMIVQQFQAYIRPSASFFEYSQLLLPSILRMTEIRDFGSDIYDVMKQFGLNVSFGGHPLAEVVVYGTDYPALLLLGSNMILVATCAVLIRVNPAYAIISVPYLALWGRSLLWITLFYIIYGGLMLALMTARYDRLARHLPSFGSRRKSPDGKIAVPDRIRFESR
jgi:hypothetical protein